MMLAGNAVSGGIAIGRVLIYQPVRTEVPTEKLREENVSEALSEYDSAREQAAQELSDLADRLAHSNPDHAKIMKAHGDMLMDPVMDEDIRALIKEKNNPAASVAQVFDMYAQVFADTGNEVMKERAADLADIKRRLLRCLAHLLPCDLSALESPVIIVADDLYPSDTVTIDREHVLGIITQTGGKTSHTAIIARSYAIPAVLGVTDAIKSLHNGETVILDGENGTVYSEPDRELQEKFMRRAEELKAAKIIEDEYLERPAVTRDGTKVNVRMNIASAAPQALSPAAYTDGCGLFRTEFLYLTGTHIPDEEEQCAIYKSVLEAFEDKPVVMRTMDIGGDKQSPFFNLPQEENPFLGIRGIRLSFEKEELFLTQIRAALRASVSGKLKIMAPMVGSLDEIYRFKSLTDRAKKELDAEGLAWNPDVKIGVMIEVPAIALMAEEVAQIVDFVSIGTNDLTQYLCAADRMNADVRPYYQEYHPALFRILSVVADAFVRQGKEISVCGELGGDPLAVPVLLGFGIRSLSMSASSVAHVKQVICSLDISKAKHMSSEILKMKTQDEIEKYLKNAQKFL